MHWNTDGSIIRDTVGVECTGVDLDLEIVSNEDPAKIAALVRTARRGCYAEAALRRPIEIRATVLLNGAELQPG